MTVQINMKFQENFFELAKEYAERKGYMSVQELVRDALREKIFDTTLTGKEEELLTRSYENEKKGKLISSDDLKSELGL